MRKRKSTRETKNMIQTALWLPREMHEELKKAGGERGLGEEIRRRLEASFDTETAPGDPKTRELREAITFIGNQTASFYGNWSVDAFAFRVLKRSVDNLLKHYQPEGDPAQAKPNPTLLGGMIFGEENSDKGEYGSQPSPEEISRTIVSMWLTNSASSFAVKQKG